MPVHIDTPSVIAIADDLKEEARRRKAGSQFLTIQEIQWMYGCAYNVARWVLKRLAREDFISQYEGFKGYFVK